MVSLMIEYMDGGSLQDIVDMGGCDDEPTLANIAVQALKGLLFLHENFQIHRDLKPGKPQQQQQQRASLHAPTNVPDACRELFDFAQGRSKGC